MMMLNVVSITGENCITVEDGEQVYQIIHPEIFNKHDVTLDFNGVEVFASPFFNAAIGQLLRDIQLEQIQTYLHITGLSDHGNHILKRVLANAQKYYSNPHFKNAVEKVLAEQAINR
jgi:hypothetical protein